MATKPVKKSVKPPVASDKKTKTKPAALAKPRKKSVTSSDKPDRKPTGRPSTYSREVTDKILELIRQGQSLASICKPDNMPAASTFRLWVADDVDDLSARSARAYSIGYDAIADQCVEIADQDPDIHPITGAKDSASVQHKRLRIDTRLRLLGKWAPKKYGDKLDLNHSGNIGIESLIAGAGDDTGSD